MALEYSNYLTYKITVLGPLSIDAKTLPNSCKDVPYAVEIFTASGGLAPYTWVHTTSILPTGMTFNDGTQILSGTPTTSGSFNLHLEVTDSNTTVATADFPFTIYTPPNITTTSTPDGIFNTAYTTTFAGTPGSGTLTTWTVVGGSLPGGLTLNPATGVLSGTITSLFGFFSYTVRLSDSNGCHFDKTFSINVTSTPLVIDTTTLPGSCRGAVYSEFLSASGGALPYTWSIVSGALPLNLSLNAGTGEISGTVDVGATVGVQNFTIEVTDNSANTAQRPLSIEVYGEPVWVTTSPLPDGNDTVPYSQFVVATGAVAYGFGAGSVPPGLNIQVGTGEIYGTPTVQGTYTFDVNAISVHGCQSTRSFTITIGAQPPTLTGTFPNICSRSKYYYKIPPVVGGTPPFTFALTSGVLPQSVTFDDVNALVQGTAIEPGNYSVDITVTDSLALSSTKTYTFTVYNSPLITSTSLPPASYGNPYSFTMQTLAGTGTIPFVWGISSGSLPAGLTFNNVYGSMFGTPTQAGDFPLTIYVSDANGCRDTVNLYMSIIGPPVIKTLSIGPACQNQYYETYIVVEGGKPPFYWFISSDNFPPQDLVLDPYTGKLSGIPLKAGTYTFAIKAIDQNGLFTEQSYSFVVRTEQECGQPDDRKKTVTKTRLIGLESQPVVVQNPFHQKHLIEYVPIPLSED